MSGAPVGTGGAAERMAREQAALLRVATLVANGVSAKALADAVTAEVGVLLGVDLAGMWRVHPDDTASAIALWAASGDHPDVSGRWPLEDNRLMSRMRRSGVPTREDAWETAEGPVAEAIRELLGVRSSVASPIVVENRLWGALIVHSTTVAHLSADTEQRLGAFTALVSTAIANAQARSDLEALAEEQAALRRVATLVAAQSPPAETLRQIAEEMGTLLGVEGTAILRYETDGTATVTAGWGEPDMTGYVGERLPFGGDNPAAYVFETRQPARETYTPQSRGPLAEISRQVGITSAAAGPIVVEQEVWGVIVVATLSPDPLPADTEARIAQFTELVATAIANVHAQSELSASRARIVRAGDVTRRRFERDLHDGVQQRLVSLALELRGVEAVLESDAAAAKAQLAAVRHGLADALDDLRELSRGLHPAVLSRGGLPPALRALGRRSAVPVRLDIDVDGRVAEEIEVAAYYVVSEALTNAVKHAKATVVDVRVSSRDGEFEIDVRDDGVGGADPDRGSGIIGLGDRIDVLGGTLAVASPPGEGTRVRVRLPVTPRPG